MPYLASDSRYNSMPYNRTGNSGLKLPQISLAGGTTSAAATHSKTDAPSHAAPSIWASRILISLTTTVPRLALRKSHSVRSIKQDFHPYRDELIISTKAGYDMWPGPYGEWGSRKYMLASLDQSLKRMGLDYVEIFYSHRFDPDTPLEETMGALDSAVRQGKALYVGISSYSPEQTRRAAQILKELGTPCLIVNFTPNVSIPVVLPRG